ncbi:MAG: rRNA ((1518)-N(6)/adenine(1519)-N(6))-dimethyltransferase [Rickettsiales bacterium]|jgi:16S rRNA (adenine1518-N6/adenine1519-N6)-dimethyltransferase|nr:rRNA ((1518)-N(6)/adenine(1519)-N(6))-dimethyltransferase [Rickettsiales bacterium]
MDHHSSLVSRLDSLPPLRKIIEHYKIAPEKKLGQNFLFDQNLTDRIAREAGNLTNTTVIEIGPGPGGLTRSLLRAGATRIIAVERDPRCLEALNALASIADGRLQIIEADALTIDESSLIEKGEKATIVSNLPYNIGTVLLFKWLEKIELFDHFVLMFQKEVADRITAHPSTKAYGRLSVMCQWLCDTRRCFDISPQAFVPPPKITSTVVHLTPRTKRLVAEYECLETVCEMTFNQRRKMLRASLKQRVPDPEQLLAAAAIAPEKRPEALTVEEFCRLAEAYRHSLRME